MLTKHIEKRLNGNCTRMLWAILNKSWKKHPTKHQLYGHFPPIFKAIKISQTRHTGHCWMGTLSLDASALGIMFMFSFVVESYLTSGDAIIAPPATIMVKEPNWFNYLLIAKEEVMDVCLSKVEGKQPHPGFELGSPNPYSMMITLMLHQHSVCLDLCESFIIHVII